MNRAIPLALGASLLLTAGCAQDGRSNQATAQTLGAVVGGVGGALLGRQVGGGVGTVVGAVVGAAAGAMIGGAIAQHLDNPRDRALAEKSTQKVLEGPARPGTSDQWRSPETPDIRGGTQLVGVSDGGNCRNVREIAIVRGQEVRQESRYCRNQAGAWVLQA